MSLNIYQDAITEAKQLREAAEQNAKNKIIEAITPQIQMMIEQQLEDEFGDELGGFDDLDDLDGEDSDGGSLDLGALSLSQPVDSPKEDDDEDGIDPLIGIKVMGDMEIDLEADDDDEDELLLSKEGIESLESFIKESKNNRISHRIEVLGEGIANLSEAISNIELSKLNPRERAISINYYGKLLREIYSLSQNIILMNESIDDRLEYQIISMLKELKDMSKANDRAAFRRLFEELAQAGLTEQDDAAEEAEEAEKAEAADVDVDAAEGALEDLGAALGLDIDISADGDDDDDDDDEELDLDLSEEDEGMHEEDEGMHEEDEGKYEMHHGKDEGMHEEDEGMHEEDEVDEVYEISEAALRRELRNMRRLREQDEAVDADPHLAHGGEEIGDVIEIDEEDLINVLADELGSHEGGAPTVESRRRRRRTSPRQNRGMVQENRKLKKQLAEMNLFNAKLLFANKLMQNRELSTKQQRAIVDALDNASTIKEAKLLYKTLSESLTRKSRKNLSESKSRILSSASRSTRSAAPAKSGVEVDRWSVLAGLNNK